MTPQPRRGLPSSIAVCERLPLAWRRALFAVLESLAALRQGTARSPARDGPPPGLAAARSLWVFVSTIGELNAISPFLNRLLDEVGQPQLVLISDRPNYGAAYLARYPQAQVEVLQGARDEAAQLAKRWPPLMLLVAEIPCLLHDAPCRLSFATLDIARQAGAVTVLVNGWLYGYAPPSRMDSIEQALFARAYVRGFDLLMVQTVAVREQLLAAGAAPAQVVVTGNIKFDAMLGHTAGANGALLLALQQRGPGPIIVAGSVTETADQQAVVEAFLQVRMRHPSALLILAPRHPENTARMALLAEVLRQARLDYRLRSAHEPAAAVATPVLVLDTMGELRACYAANCIAFVGVDHNVLEPLAFGKAVFVGPGWEPTYPSFPVYSQLLQAGALHAVASLAQLGPAWLQHLASADKADGANGTDAADGAAAPVRQRVEPVLAAARGAVDRSLTALRASPAGARALRTRAAAQRPPAA